jgi:hypothetical protein
LLVKRVRCSDLCVALTYTLLHNVDTKQVAYLSKQPTLKYTKKIEFKDTIKRVCILINAGTKSIYIFVLTDTIS